MFFLAFQAVQLVPDGTVIIHIALILLMIWILNRTFFRPINRIIETREKNKGGRFGEAEEILREVSGKQAQYNHALFEARNKGYEIIEKERTSAVNEREARVGSVKEELTRKVEQEKSQLQAQTAEARAAIAAEADKMADKISSSILRA